MEQIPIMGTNRENSHPAVQIFVYLKKKKNSNVKGKLVTAINKLGK